MTQENKYKICLKCKNEFIKSDKFFHSHKNHSDRLNSWCKACVNKSNKLRKPKSPFETWLYKIRNRCENKKHQDFRFYGGSGVKCLFKTWQELKESLGDKPSEKHSIDRINPNGNYEKGNVRWATKSQQIRNRRITKINEGDVIQIKNLLKANVLQKEIARRFKIHPATVSFINLGKIWI